MTSSLRDELGAAKEPDFEFDLPAGWAKTPVSTAAEKSVQSQLAKRLMAAGRPEILAQLRPMVNRAYSKMQDARAIATIGPMERTDDMVMVPGSIVASIRRSTAEMTVDQMAVGMIRKFNAQPLFGDPRIMRFRTEREEDMQGEKIIIDTVTYLTPVPGSKRQKALQLTASFMRPVDVPADDEPAVRIRAQFDAIVSSLRWIEPKS